MKLTQAQQKIVDAYRATGRIAVLYPRKGKIAINGFPAKPVADAVAQMAEFLNQQRRS